ncbi:MAG: ShlB/FhaC/HecB family hemolysin secretion/activation protein, partial [Pseudomonadota bacterium]
GSCKIAHKITVKLMKNQNLNSSEKFSLGGIRGVRAYPEGEANGDEGGLFTIAWRSNLAESVQGSLFYDIGTVKINKTPFSTTDNHRTLSGGGIGLDAYLSRILLKTNIAWRDRGEPTSGPDNKPRFWMEAIFPL